MYTRMLVALDGSKLAENVLPYARALAGALGLRIELLSVVESVDFARTTHAGHVRDLDPIIEAAVQESRRYLEGVARSFTGSTATCFVEQGQPEDVIIERAAGDKETLIGMATRGRSGIHRWLMGSVAEKVLRGATNPLLLVRGNEEGKSDGEATLKSIVVPLDGSKLAETVLPRAVELARKLSLEIVLTRAYQIPLSAYGGADVTYIRTTMHS
jgi:nucleotide-binding universal stress UspA family protein